MLPFLLSVDDKLSLFEYMIGYRAESEKKIPIFLLLFFFYIE